MPTYRWEYDGKADLIALMVKDEVIGISECLGIIRYDSTKFPPYRWQYKNGPSHLASTRGDAGRALLQAAGISGSPGAIKDWLEVLSQSNWETLDSEDLKTPAPTPKKVPEGYLWMYTPGSYRLTLRNPDDDFAGWISQETGEYEIPNVVGSGRRRFPRLNIALDSLLKDLGYPPTSGWDEALAEAIADGWTPDSSGPEPPSSADKPAKLNPTEAAQQVYDALTRRPAVLRELLAILRSPLTRIATPWDDGNPYHQRRGLRDGALLANVWVFKGSIQAEVHGKTLRNSPFATFDEAKNEADAVLQAEGWILLP